MSEITPPTFEELRADYVLAWSVCLICGRKCSCWTEAGGRAHPSACYPCHHKDPERAAIAVKNGWDACKAGSLTVIPFPDGWIDLPCEKCSTRRCDFHIECLSV